MVLPLAAIGASAVSQLYKSVTGQSSSQANSTQFQPSTTDPTAQQASASSDKLNLPTKLSSDISALLLSLQSASGTNASAASTSTAASTASGIAATDPKAAVQADLQNVLGDLQKASGHHHHHHGGQPGNDASSTTTTTTTTTTTSTTADTDTQSGGSSGLFSQLSKALSAYASQNAAGATPSTAGLLTA